MRKGHIEQLNLAIKQRHLGRTIIVFWFYLKQFLTALPRHPDILKLGPKAHGALKGLNRSPGQHGAGRKPPNRQIRINHQNTTNRGNQNHGQH